MTRPRPDAPADVERFARPVRWVHWTAGGLVLVCLVTAALLYNGVLASRVGDRYLVEQVHVWSGYGVAVPLVLGLLTRACRADLRRLDRFSPDDWRWLRSRSRRDGRLAVGKFNAGQKLNAALSAGGLGVLALTGTVMLGTSWTGLAQRAGATFVHDWAALCLGLLVAGHLLHALSDGEAMRGMRSGRVSRRWARQEHARWLAELERSGPPPGE